MAVVAGAAPTALWHTVDCVSQCGRLGVGLVVRVVWGCPCLVRSVMCAVRCYGGCTDPASLEGAADERRRFRLARCACGGVCGFEAEDGQEDGTREGGEPPAAGINQNFAYLDETRLPAPALR